MTTKTSEMEPLFPEYRKDILLDKASKVLTLSVALGAKLANETARSISELVRLMNSYYSNLIEGNRTTPVEIEKAIADKMPHDKKREEKIYEHLAHVKTEELIDRALLSDVNTNIFTTNFICGIHKSFYEFMPEEFRFTLEKEGEKIKISGGELRDRNVTVGAHFAPDYKSVKDLLNRFCEAYGANYPNPLERIIAIAASHHRLAWIHPFMDGNGRTARLFTHAFLIKAGIDNGGLWSISRGFARDVNNYYGSLAAADAARRNDLDGRGNLSDRGLFEFCNYFLDTALDQVEYMTSLYDLENITARIKKYIDLNDDLRPESFAILREAFIMGEVKRGDAAMLTGLHERTARRIVSELLKRKLLVSASHKSPLRISFPVGAAEYYLPRLFPAI